jgi:mannosyltransferase
VLSAGAGQSRLRWITPGLAALGLVAVALLLRLYRLDHKSLWLDEVLTVHFAHRPSAWLILSSTDVHPPLYYLLAKGTLALSESVFALRFLSAVASATAVWFVFALGRELFDVRTGLVAGFLMAISPFQVWHAQDARMYALLTLLIAAASHVLLRALAVGGWRHWLTYAALASLALYTHHVAAFSLLAHSIYVLLIGRNTKWILRRFGGALAIAAVLYAPGIASALRQFGQVQAGYWMPRPTLGLVGSTLVAFSSFMLNMPPTLAARHVPDWTLHVVVAIFALLGAAGIWTERHRPRAITLPVLLFAVPFAAVLVYSLAGPISIYQDRVLIGATAGYSLLAARGVTGPTERAGRILAAVGLAVIVFANAQSFRTLYITESAKHPFKRAMEETIARMSANDLLAFSPTYLRVLVPLYSGRANVRLLPEQQVGSAIDLDGVAATARSESDRRVTVWLLYLETQPVVIERFTAAMNDVGRRETSTRAYGAGVFVAAYTR